MGSLLFQNLADDYPDRLNVSFPVFPSSETSDVVTEPYNAVLSLPNLVQNCDLAFTLDNWALQSICARDRREVELQRRGGGSGVVVGGGGGGGSGPGGGGRTMTAADATMGDVNRLVAEVMSGVTASLRFKGQLNSSLRKLGVNLVPYPRLHFLVASQSPTLHVNPYTPSSVKRLVKEMTSPRNLTVDCDPRMGRYLSASALFRGEDLCTQEVDAALRWLQYKGSAEWAWVSIYSHHQGP